MTGGGGVAKCGSNSVACHISFYIFVVHDVGGTGPAGIKPVVADIPTALFSLISYEGLYLVSKPVL